MDTIFEQVQEFMEAAEQTILPKPKAPDDELVRMRLSLVTEESFELLEACGLNVTKAKMLVREAIRTQHIKVDMTAAADAYGDIDYVVEGGRRAFGIDGRPIAAEIQRSNMAKFGPGSWKREDGKQMKPPGWTPPDIAGELRKQGWED